MAWGEFHRSQLKRPDEGLLHQAHSQLLRLFDMTCSTASKSCRLLAVLHVLSFSPRDLQTSLTLCHALPVAEGELRCSEVGCGDPAAALIGAAACQRHTGFCEGGLNGIAVDLFRDKRNTTAMEPVLPTSSQVAVPESVDDMPWEWKEISEGGAVTRVNFDLLKLFAEKVLSVLAQRPGSDVSAVHSALQVLSLAQAQRLLEEMTTRGWVKQTAVAVTSRLCNPFSSREPCYGSPTTNVYFKI